MLFDQNIQDSRTPHNTVHGTPISQEDGWTWKFTFELTIFKSSSSSTNSNRKQIFQNQEKESQK